MKRFALLTILALVAYGVNDAQAANKINTGGKQIGGKRATSGRVNFELNGGAGINPRFQTGGSHDGVYGRAAHRRAEVGNYPVAVGYGGGGCCGSNYFGDGGFSNLYTQGFIPVPPYFSLHPPVYYSVPVPRTYGYSPFAYPGGVPTPEVTMGPEEIINPHVVPEEVPEPAQEASNKTASAPLVIRNPFVEQGSTVTLTADVR